jgi:hypothetical protein
MPDEQAQRNDARSAGARGNDAGGEGDTPVIDAGQPHPARVYDYGVARKPHDINLDPL